MIGLGGAESVWSDLDAARALVGDRDYHIGAVNEAARDFPGHLDLWCTLHQEKLEKWQRGRERAGRNTDYLCCSHKGHPLARVDRIYKEVWPGSSGLFLCTTAVLALGYEKVIICGIPMDGRPHYHKQQEWRDAEHYRRAWSRASRHPHMEDRIKSMSGWTREKLLGPPTKDWITS